MSGSVASGTLCIYYKTSLVKLSKGLLHTSRQLRFEEDPGFLYYVVLSCKYLPRF
jgi:hypothetical protein